MLNSSTTEVTESSISHRNENINDNNTLNSGKGIRNDTIKNDGTDQ